jgi:hypothetical protein
MGKLTSSFRKSIFDEIVDNISSNTSHYYAFAAGAEPWPGDTPTLANTDYDVYFENDWQMHFGKRLLANNFSSIVKKYVWTSNTVYDRYDNTKDMANSMFYVIAPPTAIGGAYHVYKCIDNANGAASIKNPSSIGTPTQSTTFETTEDGYKWRYLTSVSTEDFDRFSTTHYAPVYPNTTIQAASLTYSGIETVVVSNVGAGYETYHNGTLQGITNSTALVIESNASISPGHYVNNSIYLYSSSNNAYQIFNITGYTVNGPVRTVILDSAANTTALTAGASLYKISPRILFTSDTASGNNPTAYTTVNTVTNSISGVVVLDKGSSITWANAVVVSNSSYGSGATVYPIVPPPGGHGRDPATELGMQGISISFTFANTESNTISSNVVYNKIGLIKNPYSLIANNQSKGSRYSSNTFSQIQISTCTPAYTFSNADVIIGANSKARATVVWSNGSTVHYVGDKYFIDGENILNTNNQIVTSIAIESRGDIFVEDLYPLYVQNINNTERSNTQSETFRLVIKL